MESAKKAEFTNIVEATQENLPVYFLDKDGK
jgi:hypothetical protein